GNYGFFNLVALALCVLLIDDRTWARRRPAAVAEPVHTWRGWRWPLWITIPLAAVILSISGTNILLEYAGLRQMPGVTTFCEFCQPLRSVNNYGLFRVMTTQRREILI